MRVRHVEITESWMEVFINEPGFVSHPRGLLLPLHKNLLKDLRFAQFSCLDIFLLDLAENFATRFHRCI